VPPLVGNLILVVLFLGLVALVLWNRGLLPSLGRSPSSKNESEQMIAEQPIHGDSAESPAPQSSQRD